MDPTSNLKEQREIAERILSGKSSYDDASRLAELVEALDQWIQGGGFLPEQWRSEG